MTDEGRVHSTVAIELFFKRKNHQRFIDVVAQQTHASLAPGPELRRNVIHHWNAAPLHLPRHAPVEGRRVDDDGEIRLAPVSFFDQVLIKTVDLWQMAEDFGDADDREVFRVDDGIAASSAHALSADAEEFKLRCSCGVRGLCGYRCLCGDSRPRLSSGAQLRWLSLGSPMQSINDLCPIHFPGSLAG